MIAWHLRSRIAPLVVLAAGAVLVDVARHASGIDEIGLLNLAFVWLLVQQIGFWYADGWFDRRHPAVLLAILIAAGVATANGLASAQLAASHPVSGGAYEYGYKYLNPTLGFTAGWVFLLAKSASAATAALGFGGYFLNLFGVTDPALRTAVALAAPVSYTHLTLPTSDLV